MRQIFPQPFMVIGILEELQGYLLKKTPHFFAFVGHHSYKKAYSIELF
jgi:hypothetical protein